jgi:hypothetical protein
MLGFRKKRSITIRTVRFDAARVTEQVRADLWAAVLEFEDLPLGEERSIYEAALEGISRGRDLSTIAKAMIDRGMSRGRASQVSGYLANRATSMMDAAEMVRLGLERASWMWSGACTLERHQEANNEAYNPASGLLIAGRSTWPGREFGCSCVSRAIVPGFD